MTEYLTEQELRQLDECIIFEVGNGTKITYVDVVFDGRTMYVCNRRQGRISEIGFESGEWLYNCDTIKLPSTDKEIEYALEVIDRMDVVQGSTKYNVQQQILRKYRGS